MHNSEIENFSKLMFMVAENYGQTLTPERIAFLFQFFEQYEFEAIKQAAFSLLANRKYTSFPTVADFVEYLGGGSAEDKALVEAGKVLKAISREGAYASVVFDDPVTQAVIVNAYGSWPTLCQEVTEVQKSWFIKDFSKTYAAYTRQSIKQYGHLMGITESSNAARGVGKKYHRLALIGDEFAARVVLAGELEVTADIDGAVKELCEGKRIVACGGVRA